MSRQKSSKMFKVFLWGLALLIALALMASDQLIASAQSQTIFSETFGSPPCATPLSAPDWFGKGGSPTPFSGIVTTDPQDLDNCVLTFTQLTFAGDAFSKLITAAPGLPLILEFDYLGDPTRGGVPGDLGGTIGISDGFPAGHRWLAGTRTTGSIEQDLLVDDGTWRHYSILFDPFQATECCGYSGSGSFHVMLEDFVESGGVAGDAYFDNITIKVAAAQVNIDIKPGSDPNSINPDSTGVIPVAILTTDTFDATTVDPLSIEFGPVGATESHSRGHIEDIDGDGDLDLVLHFRTQDTGIQCGNISASLTGETFSGQAIQGSDSINTVRCP